MRVAIDARLLGGTSTGDSTYWTCLVPALLEAEPDLRLVLISNEPVPFTHARAEIVVHSAPDRTFSLRDLPRLAQDAGADLLHVQYAVPPFGSVPVVSTYHDISFLLSPRWFGPRDRVLLTLGARAAARRARRILTVSETSRREIERRLPGAKGKVDVALNACPPWIARPPKAEIERRLDRLGVPRPYLLTVGTRWPRKNMELALEACDRLPGDLPHRLVVTGKHGDKKPLGERGVATGYVDEADLSALYAGADLYLAPSLHEGFGLPIVEAMRCGCPVLTTGLGAMKEVGDAAVAIVPPEASFWASEIEDLLRDAADGGGRLRDLRARGTERERTFTWANSARATLACYRAALNGPR